MPHLNKDRPTLIDMINKPTLNSDKSQMNSIKQSNNASKNSNKGASNNVRIDRKCFVCKTVVKKENYFFHHLFFGVVKCLKCKQILETCIQYSKFKSDVSLGRRIICNHYLVYIENPVGYLRKQLSSDHGYECNTPSEVKVIKSYLSGLKVLETGYPWHPALRLCKYFTETAEKSLEKEKPESLETETKNGNADLKQYEKPNKLQAENNNATKRKENDVSYVPLSNTKSKTVNYSATKKKQNDAGSGVSHSDSTKSQTENSGGTKRKQNVTHSDISLSNAKLKVENNSKKDDEVQKEKSTKKSRTKKSKSNKNESLEYVPIPKDGFYYVSPVAIENCPNCYEILCPSQFTVNIETFLITTICVSCNLTIYITVISPEVLVLTND